MENSPSAPRDFSKMTDAELDAAIGQAQETAPSDFSKMTDAELDASISAASAPAPAPSFEFDDVAKGMSADEASRAASYPKVAQSMLDRHAKFTGRMAADGGFKLSGEDESDYEYFKWAERRGVFGDDPTWTDYAGAVGKSLWQIVKGGAKLAKLTGKAVLTSDVSPDATVELAATTVDAARGAVSEYQQLGAGAAVLLSGDNPEVKSAAKYELLKFSMEEQKNHNAWRKAISDRFAEVPVDEDSVEALSEAFDISNLIGAGAGKALVRSVRRAGVGGTEWLDQSRKVLGSEALARGIAKIPVIGTSQKRAILTGQVDLLSVEAQQAYNEVATAQAKLAAARLTLAENGVGGVRMDPLLAAVTDSELAVAASTVSYKAAQTQLDGARRAVSDVLDLEGRGLLNIAAAGTVDAAGKATKFTGDTITSAWDSTKKFLTGSADNALADTLAPGIVSQGNVISRAGRDLSGVAAQIRANGASIPFFRRVAQAEGIGKLTKAGAAFADWSHLGWVADKGSELVGAGLAGAPVSGAFGYVASGGDKLAAAGSAGGGMAFGISGGAYGQWQSYADPRFRHEELLANRRQFRDTLAVRPVNGQSQLQVFDKMDAGEQLILSTYAQGHPDVAFRLIDDDKGPSGYYDRDNNVVVLNRASKTSIPDIFRHEVAHFIERHGMEAQVRELYFGDAEKGVVGQYTAFGADGKPIDFPSVGPDGQPTRTYHINAEGEALRLQYEKKVQAFDPTFTMSREYFASELFAEQYADHAMNGGMRRDMSRNAVDSTFEALASVPLLKGFMGGIGLMFDQNDTVVGTEVFSGMARNEGVVKLISAWNSESGKGRRAPIMGEADTHVFTERELRDPAVAKKWLQGGGSMRFGPDGAPVYNANGTPQFLTDKEAEAAQRDLANELIVAIERHVVDNPNDADVMQRRENTDMSGRVSVTYSGRKIPASVIDALEAQKRFNPHQLAHLRAMSASVDEHGVGAMIAHFYQAASAKLSGKAYKTTGGRWRRDGVVGFQITKDGNVAVNSVSWEVLAESARKAASTAAARDLYQTSGVDISAAITADVKTYLENVVAGRPGSEGLGDKRRDFINNLFGIRMASNEDVNPFFATTKSPKPILTTLRLDRINRLAPLDSVEIAWGPAEYRRVKANLRPESTDTDSSDVLAREYSQMVEGKSDRQLHPGKLKDRPDLADENGKLAYPQKKYKTELTLTHYSNVEGLKTIDPKFMGTGGGKDGTTNLRMMAGEKKSFYFVGDSKGRKGENVSAASFDFQYKVKVDPARLYDMDADPANLWYYPNPVKSEGALKAAGYDGFTASTADGRSFVTLFHPVDTASGKMTRTSEAPAASEVAKPAKLSKVDREWAAWQKKIAGGNLSMRPEGRTVTREIGDNADFAKPPTDEAAIIALSKDKKPMFAQARELPEGTPVGLRIDIPAYRDHGVYVVTVHEKATPSDVGDRIGYDTVVSVSDPKFFVKEGDDTSKGGAQAIKDGRAKKHPIATVEGAFNPSREVPSDIESWTPVGFDPKDHSYFYDKRTDEPVLSGSQAVSVGNTVFVKDPVYGDKKNFQYRVDNAQTETPEFKKWFGDSKVVDEQGAPLALFHGATRDIGPKFKAGKEGGSLGNGIYFTPDPKVAEGYTGLHSSPGNEQGSNISKVFVSLKNPLKLDTANGSDPMVQAFEKLGMSPDKAEAFVSKQYDEKGYIYNQVRNRAVKAGYDGIMQTRDGKLAEVVAFDSTQVKSATGNRGTFDGNNPDIQFHPGALTRDNVPKKRDVEDFITLHALTPAEAEAYRGVVDNVRSADPSALPIDPQYDAAGRPKFEVTPAVEGSPEVTEVKVSPVRYDFIEAPEVRQIRDRNETKHDEKIAALEEKRKGADRATAAKINAKIAEAKADWKREGQFAWRDEASDILADRLVAEAEKAMLEPSTKAGLGWYSNMRAWLQNRFGAGIEVFSQLLGASSARTPVDENFKQALDAMTRLSRGDYDQLLQSFDDHVNAVREKVDAGSLDDDGARKEINKFVEVPTRSNGKKFNANSAKVLQALYGNWLEMTQGPKTPNFAGNLSGRILAATIDVWAARTARRVMYQNKTYNAETGRISNAENKWRILPEAETGVEFGRKIGLDIGGDFGFAQEAFQKAADRLGMEADNLQALIWYHEKHIWDVNNWTRASGRIKSSFESEAGKLDTERFQLGITTDTGPSNNFDAHVIDDTFHRELKQTRDAVTKLPGVVYARVTPSGGLYGGKVEPSFDGEFAVRRGSDVSPILSHLIETGMRSSQYDVFLSKVVDRGHPNARPGLEIGFKSAETQQFVDDLSAGLRAAGIDGFTVARDSRNRPIGLRAQFVPEISARWAAVKEDLLDPVKADALAGAWTEKSRAALKSLQPDFKTRLSYEQETYFDTRVFGREEYSTASRIWAETTLEGELGRRKQALAGAGR